MWAFAAILDDAATLIERISYDAFGCARHHWMHDVDGDGTASGSDHTTITTLAAASGGVGTGLPDSNYNADADLNRDGLVSSADSSISSGLGTLAALPRGRLIGRIRRFTPTCDAGL